MHEPGAGVVPDDLALTQVSILAMGQNVLKLGQASIQSGALESLLFPHCLTNIGNEIVILVFWKYSLITYRF